MKNNKKLILLPLVISMMLIGCSHSENKNTSKEANTDPIQYGEEGNTDSNENEEEIEVNLNNTYTTRFEKVNLVTYPAFSFDYPSNWTITSEEVTQYSEKVVLSNGSGVEVTYWYDGDTSNSEGTVQTVNLVDVTKEENARFVPGSVQAYDYSSLGNFVVAKLDIKEQCDKQGDGEFHKVKGESIRYALLPESEIGQKEENCIEGQPTFSFCYGGDISFIASSDTGTFTKQEAKEVISILSSFRTA